MIFTTFLKVSLLPAFAVAQYGYGGGGGNTPTTTTSSAAVAVPTAPPDSPGQINVDVGINGTFAFHPANITAKPGTLVTFYVADPGYGHSITQSSFDTPCTYLAASGNSSGGFDSGLTRGTQFTLNITDDTPIYFHCKQVTHCGLGMVGSINAPASGQTYEAFLNAAKAIGSNEVTETDSGLKTGGVGAIATASPSSSSSTPSAPPSSGSTKKAANVGIALLAVSFVALLA